MRAGHVLDGYRLQMILPLAALGSALAIGLIPSLWTMIALDLGLTVAALTAVIRRARREGGLALREADGSAYVPFGLALFLIASGIFIAALATMVLFLPWDTPPEAACLCLRPTGLGNAAIDGIAVVMLAGFHTAGLLTVLSSSARLALGLHPQPPRPPQQP